MTFREWALFHELEDWDRPVFLSIVTDGLSAKKHNVLALVVGEADDRGYLQTEVIGIPLGDPEKTEPFTGFGKVEHEECLWALDDLSRLPARFRDRTVVSYTVDRFCLPFLDTLSEYTVRKPLHFASAVLDVQTLWTINATVEGFDDMTPVFSRTCRSAGKLESLFEQTGLSCAWEEFLREQPVYMRKIYMTHLIHQTLCAS